MFGAPFYGDRILGRLVYGASKGHNHCNETDYAVPDMDILQSKEGPAHDQVRLINIIMVRRGECSFVTKVKVASAKGAHAVIIVDREDSPLKSHDLQNIIVADDGYGKKISIPSVLISHFDGDKLIDACKAGEVVIELAWVIPTGVTVTMDLWMSSGSRESHMFLKDFWDNRKKLNEVVKFLPHYHIFSSTPENGGYNDLCTDETAKYCAEDPDGSGDITGRDVVEEDVRQLCIHEKTRVRRYRHDKKTAEAVYYAEKWWDYVTQLFQECPIDGETKDTRFGEKCSYALMERLDIDTKQIRHCFDTTKDAKLESERINKAWSPRALRVNGWRYKGILDAELVTRAVCSGFVKKPTECSEILKPRDPTVKYLTRDVGGISFSTLVVAFICLAAFIGCVMFLYRKFLNTSLHARIREEVMLEVTTKMEEYRQLK
jgi:hypothetical protein